MRVAGTAVHRIFAALIAVSAGSACSSCRRSDPPSVGPDPSQTPPPDPDESPKSAVPRRDASVVSPLTVSPCISDAPRWLVPVRDASVPGPSDFESSTAVTSSAGVWAAWLERSSATFVIQPPTGNTVRIPIGPGEMQPPAMASIGDDLVLALPLQRPTGRVHRVMRVRGSEASELFTTNESPDDDYDLDLATTPNGVLLVWSDAAPRVPSAIQSQFVPLAAIQAGTMATPPPVRPLTPPEHDASDPVLASRANGTIVLAWLVNHEVDDVIANATTADVFVRSIDGTAQNLGIPVQISPGPGNRFGVRIVGAGDSVWVTYRVAGDADQESQGDGGLVAVMRLGADLHPSASPAYVSERDGNPSGEASLVVDERGGATVFWTERSGDSLTTWRRAAEPDGRVIRRGSPESGLRGEVPFAGDAARPWVLVHGRNGEPGVVRMRCPPQPLPPTPVLPPAR